MKKYCPICKELETDWQQKAHEPPSYELQGTNLFRRVLSCGCSMSKCHAGVKQYYQCEEHRLKVRLGEGE